MADGDLLRNGTKNGGASQASLTIAESDGHTYWFGDVRRGPCWRKYIAIDGATGAVDGVYCKTQGADHVNIHTEVGTSANVRIWGEDTEDGAQPGASTENNQIGAAITADGTTTVTDPPEWMKAEATAASGTLNVIFTAVYKNGRP